LEQKEILDQKVPAVPCNSGPVVVLQLSNLQSTCYLTGSEILVWEYQSRFSNS